MPNDFSIQGFCYLTKIWMPKLNKPQQGFTMIELMIVVAIIGLLSSIAIPAYQIYTKDTADNACALQTKAFFNNYLLADKTGRTVPVSTSGACDAPATISSTTISATAKSPGSKTTTCTVSTTICVTY